MHCCLHLVGQIVSVGRLDQLLISYYKRDIRKGILTPERVCFDILLWSYHIRYTGSSLKINSHKINSPEINS